MENQPIDQTALILSRAIRQKEGGDYTNMTGDNGTSAGAYQWNNGKIPLKKGEVPANFKSGAEEFKLDPNDFSQTNQDHLAYLQIKKDLDSGLSQSQIAAKWNSGLTHGWENHIGDTVINGKTIHYDTPSYVNDVKKYYEQQVSGKSNDSSSSDAPQFPFTSQKDVQQNQDSGTDNSLLAGDPKTEGNFTDSPVGKGILNVIGGGKLAQGLGYALSNLTGTQDKAIEAQDQGAEIQKGLIQRIKENKAAGRDTTRLQKALNELNKKQEQSGNDITNVGTGGITDGQVLASGGQLGLTALGGAFAGGTFSKGTALANPEVGNILKGALGKGETLANLSRQDAITTLTNYLKEMSVSESGGKTEQLVLKAIQELNPSIEKSGILSKGTGLTKGLLKEGAGYLVGQTIGSTGKRIFDHFTR